MLLTLSTTHNPATDIGFLLHKNPFRSQSAELPFGKVHTFYPEASAEKCTVAILLDIDPVDLVRSSRNPRSAMQLEQYVNDRPYVCSSFLSVALACVFGQAMHGRCAKHPELAAKIMPLTCTLSVLPCRGGEEFLKRLFEPLGYEVSALRHTLDSTFPEWGYSSYYSVELKKETTLAEILNHLYVLVPVLDNQKHYYIDRAEIDKLLARGEGWLSNHPERETITRRYLKGKSSFTREALGRLLDINPADERETEEAVSPNQEDVDSTLNLNETRLGSVLSVLRTENAETVLDLGCGEGSLLRLLLKEKQLKKITGLDVSIRALERASERLGINDLPQKQRERIELLHGSLMYRDARIHGFDAAAIVEVIEHLDAPRLSAFERTVFEFARPGTVIITTPNREYNVRWETIGSDSLRHPDHRFEWTRPEFSEWANRIAIRYGYSVRFLPVGTEAEGLGAPTQMAIFKQVKGD